MDYPKNTFHKIMKSYFLKKNIAPNYKNVYYKVFNLLFLNTEQYVYEFYFS